jgi:hypothetical protein
MIISRRIMNHLQQLVAELNELVRRVRHDKKLLEVLQVGFDQLELFVHLEVTSAPRSRQMKSGLE